MTLCNCSHHSECQFAAVRAAGGATFGLCQSSQPHRDVFAVKAKHVRKVSAKSGPGTELEKLFSNLVEIPPQQKKSCGCGNLRDEMNRKGVEWCRQNRDTYIVPELLKKRELLQSALATQGVMGKLKSVVVSVAPEEALRFGAAKLVDTAIDKAKKKPRARRSRRGNPWAMGADRRFVTSQQFAEDIKSLASMLPSDITAIAGVARSGLSAATMISMYLHLPMLTIRQTRNDIVPTGNGWRLGGSRHVDPKTQKVAVIDDTVMTGNSLKAIEPLLREKFGDYITATVYCNPKANQKPDIHAVDLPWPHMLEWNIFNSVLSPNMAVDFDGILCHNCHPHQDDDGPKYLDFIANAKPLYLPRKEPIPLIVTARIEKYRKQTEDWLRRHGVRWNRLVMHPAKSTRERERDDVVAYKSKHFAKWAKTHRPTPPPLAFIESEDWQAKGIAKRTGLMTICPASGKVY